MHHHTSLNFRISAAPLELLAARSLLYPANTDCKISTIAKSSIITQVYMEKKKRRNRGLYISLVHLATHTHTKIPTYLPPSLPHPNPHPHPIIRRRRNLINTPRIPQIINPRTPWFPKLKPPHRHPQHDFRLHHSQILTYTGPWSPLEWSKGALGYGRHV